MPLQRFDELYRQSVLDENATGWNDELESQFQLVLHDVFSDDHNKMDEHLALLRQEYEIPVPTNDELQEQLAGLEELINRLQMRS